MFAIARCIRFGTILAAILIPCLQVACPAPSLASSRPTPILDAAATTLRDTPVYFSTAYPGTVNGNDLNDLRHDIDSGSTAIRIAFLPSAVVDETGNSQLGAASALLGKLQAETGGSWAVTVAVVLPGVIVSASSDIPSHSTLLMEANDSEARKGNVAVLRNWVEKLQDAPTTTDPINSDGFGWLHLAGWLLCGLILGCIVGHFLRRYFRNRQTRAAQLNASFYPELRRLQAEYSRLDGLNQNPQPDALASQHLAQAAKALKRAKTSAALTKAAAALELAEHRLNSLERQFPPR